MFDEMRKTVLWHAKRGYEEKLFAGTSGNLSVYDRDAQVMAITPSSLHYGLMTEEDIVIMKLDGTIVEGRRKPSSEWQMHQAIYQEKPDVNAVVRALYNRKACTMADHGAVAVGESLEKAYLSAIYLEDVAKIYCLTPDKSDIHVIPEDIVDKMREKYHLPKD